MATETDFLSNISARLGRSAIAEPNGVIPQRMDRPSRSAAMSDGERVDLFALEARRIGAIVEIFDSREAVRAALAEKLSGHAPQSIGSWSFSAMEDWELGDLSGSAVWLHPDAPDFLENVLGIEIGITGADSAVADTGTLVLRADALRPRSISLTPRVHIALLEASQIVPHMSDSLRLFHSIGVLPSALQFITGPSRSADIENDLSIGVHGPAEVHVLIAQTEPRDHMSVSRVL